MVTTTLYYEGMSVLIVLLLHKHFQFSYELVSVLDVGTILETMVGFHRGKKSPKDMF